MAGHVALLDSVELLENILNFTTPQDVLKAIGVCKFFKTVIDNSPQLQQKLFLKPQHSANEVFVKNIEINAFIFHQTENHSDSPKEVRGAGIKTFNFNNIPPEAKVWGMFLTQPPTTSVRTQGQYMPSYTPDEETGIRIRGIRLKRTTRREGNRTQQDGGVRLRDLLRPETEEERFALLDNHRGPKRLIECVFCSDDCLKDEGSPGDKDIRER